MGNNSNLYKLDGKVPLMQAIPFGLQHVLAMFVANITPIIILANVVGIAPTVSAALIQNCMIIAGIGTLVQLYPIWRIGSRLPIVMGISFTFLSVSLTIGTSHSMGVLMGVVIIGGLLEGLLGLFAKYWIKLIPHIVAATVVTAIGFSLLPIGANSFAGGQGAADFGAANNWLVGTFTLLVCLGFQIFGKGFLRSLSVLIGLIAGYILAMCMGMVDFSGLSNAGVVSLPQILPFKPEFDLGATLSIIAIFLSATETIGDTSALCSSALKRTTHKIEMGASVACDGFVSSIAGIFGLYAHHLIQSECRTGSHVGCHQPFYHRYRSRDNDSWRHLPCCGAFADNYSTIGLGRLYHYDVRFHYVCGIPYDGELWFQRP